VVKGISVRLLDLIAHRDNLNILCGDIGNAFITADCLDQEMVPAAVTATISPPIPLTLPVTVLGGLAKSLSE
jgi:hypothetical protein